MGAAAVLEEPIVGAEPALAVDDDTQRMRPGTPAHRELRVVMADGAGADENGISQRAHAMGVSEIRLAGNPARGASHRGDAPVEALAEMGDDDRPAGRQLDERQVELDQRRDIGRGSRRNRA